MLIHDMRRIGNNILVLRKKIGLTQAELAEKAGLADRTYADIERGNVNMRIETLLKICDALHVTPDCILTDDDTSLDIIASDITKRFDSCGEGEKRTALALLDLYLRSVK